MSGTLNRRTFLRTVGASAAALSCAGALAAEKKAAAKKADDPGLIALYFQYGRYLLISSSRSGDQPANLQGIWADSIKTEADAVYTLTAGR